MKNYFKLLAANKLSKALGQNAEDIYNMLELGGDKSHGDVSLPCFSFAKVLKKSPAEIAGSIKEQLKNDKLFENIEVLGGYLNLFFKRKMLGKEFLAHVSENPKFMGDVSPYVGKTSLLEHTSINPNASPHMGRARNSLIGDATKRVLQFLGYNVETHYFVNDIGKQISLLVLNCKCKDLTFNNMLKLYIEANEKMKNDPKLEQEVYKQLELLEGGDKAALKEFRRVVGICIEGISKIFGELNITFDSFDYESKYIVDNLVEGVIAKLKKLRQFFEDIDGCYAIDLEKFNINPNSHILRLTRANKTSLYPLRDICYSIDKVSAGKDLNIMVLGEDQKLYGREINAVLSLLGYESQQIINYSFVLLPEGKMSTRAGNVVLLEDFMSEVVARANEKITERMGQQDIILAKIIGYGALKYSILKCSNDKNVLFNWEEAFNFNGDSAVYIQYQYSRTVSLLSKGTMGSKADFSLLTGDTEWDILLHLSKFTSMLQSLTENFNFTLLTGYVYSLAQKFSKFYNDVKILNADSEELKTARLHLVKLVGENVRDCLNMLGIEVSERI